MDKEKQIQVRVTESAHIAAKVEAARRNIPLWQYVSWLILSDGAKNPASHE